MVPQSDGAHGTSSPRVASARRQQKTKVTLTLQLPWPDTQQEMPLNPLPKSNAAAPAIEQRAENRLHVAVPVKVFPDIKSADSQTCCTYEISLTGARLAAVPGIREVGQIVFLQRQNRRARHKVIWIGQADTSQAGQMGVESIEPGNVIWENELRVRIRRG